MNLKTLGWNDYFQESLNIFSNMGYTAGRIYAEHKNIYKIYTESGEILGEISGRFHFGAQEQQDYPAVGDWVAITERPQEGRATIHSILPRKSKFSRKAAGPNTQEQIVASNIDTIFLVTSLNHQFNLRRLERYLIMAWESGANPVIILSKSDMCQDIEEKISDVSIIAPGVPVHAISSLLGEGIQEIRDYLTPGKTVALMGPSGVGKSTLINYLIGREVMKVQDISSFEDKGRHTSTYRELFILPEGGLIIDTPGMREFQLWESSDGLSETFEDIEALAKLCRFGDCTHGREPDCAVKAALRDGTLQEGRYESYKKLQKELSFIETKQKNLVKVMERKSNHSKNQGVRDKRISYDY